MEIQNFEKDNNMVFPKQHKIVKTLQHEFDKVLKDKFYVSSVAAQSGISKRTLHHKISLDNKELYKRGT